MPAPLRGPRQPVELKLPPIDQRRVIGAGLVKRAATIMLLVFAAAIVIAVILGSLISVPVTVSGSGVLEPVRVVPVRPSHEGVIRHVLVNTGDTVRAGQPLIVLDSLDPVTSLSALEAQERAVLVAREQLVAATPTDRQRLLAQSAQADAHVQRAMAALVDRMVAYGLGKNVDSLLRTYVPGTHINVDLALSDLRSAQAEQRVADAEARHLDNAPLAIKAEDAKLSGLRANIAAARARLERLTIRAPTDGIVLTEQLDRLTGAYVRPGEQLLEVGNPGAWRAAILVREGDIHEIRRGDSVSVEVPALRELRVPRLYGVVEAIGSTPGSLATADSAMALASGGYRVMVSLDPRHLHAIGIDRFRRGYSATGKIVIKRDLILRLLYDRAASQVRRHTADLR